MQKSKYVFSKFKGNEFKALHSALSKGFNITQDDLKSLYDEYIKEFEFEPNKNTNKTLPRDIFRSDNEDFQRIYKDASVIGIDIPSIFEKENDIPSNGTIMIVGQDPLRKEKEWQEGIIVETPYALHSKYCREELYDTRLYFDLIEVLMEQNYRVYLTDKIKLWVSPSTSYLGKNKKNSFSREDQTRFIKILKSEIDIFAPLAVVAWGKEAGKVIDKIEKEIGVKCFKFLHPSKANNGAFSKKINKGVSKENKKKITPELRKNLWKEEVCKHLEELRK
jgi:Uracil DNA glycosylase superfamily